MTESTRRIEARLLLPAKSAYDAVARVETLPKWENTSLQCKRFFIAAVRQVMREQQGNGHSRERPKATSKPISGVAAADILPLAEHAKNNRYAAGTTGDSDRVLLAEAGFKPG